jgi:hypothetical protein
MEGDIFAIVQLVQLVTHVLEQQPILLRVAFQTSFQQPQNEFDPSHGNHASLVNVHDIPGVLEIPDVRVGQQGILFVRVKQ